jgi:hypothetical protein
MDLTRVDNGELVLTHAVRARRFPYFDNIAWDGPCIHRRQIKVLVDTGSSDSWMDSTLWCNCREATEGKILEHHKDNCEKVEKLKQVSPTHSLLFGDGFEASGNIVHGNVWLKNTFIKDMSFLAAWDFPGKPDDNVNGGIGLGYRQDQSIQNIQDDEPAERYMTLPEVLVRDGRIVSRAYSMWYHQHLS